MAQSTKHKICDILSHVSCHMGYS